MRIRAEASVFTWSVVRARERAQEHCGCAEGRIWDSSHRRGHLSCSQGLIRILHRLNREESSCAQARQQESRCIRDARIVGKAEVKGTGQGPEWGGRQEAGARDAVPAWLLPLLRTLCLWAVPPVCSLPAHLRS